MKTKSFLKLAMAVVVLSIGIVSCEKDSTNTQTTKEEKGAIIETPEKIIPISKAINEYNNFYTTRIAPFEAKSTQEENRAVWFDLQTLENYLQKTKTIANQKGIEITNYSFIFGADNEGKRTLFLAPMSIDAKTKTNKAFTIENDKVKFLYENPFDDYSSSIGSDNKVQSLILSNGGYISSKDAIVMYNNYYDKKVAPIEHIVEKDTRVCFYKQGIFENYLSYIKQQANNKGVNLNGVNLVFGVYDNSASLGEYANHQTLFFAPTIVSKTKNNTTISYTFNGNDMVSLDFNQNILSKIVAKSSNIASSSLANELNGSPPRGFENNQ
ncbi:hypothetical protein [Aquimarina macrocephali]|uniref:hypothetical protein n=1 Tax=Aquimarina macrocephali TaxID=666563 RepID=UPI0004645752|nr:hypothetical protein [Aquimarina macrocephali]